jgi:hypothetical protein
MKPYLYRGPPPPLPMKVPNWIIQQARAHEEAQRLHEKLLAAGFKLCGGTPDMYIAPDEMTREQLLEYLKP